MYTLNRLSTFSVFNLVGRDTTPTLANGLEYICGYKIHVTIINIIKYKP